MYMAGNIIQISLIAQTHVSSMPARKNVYIRDLICGGLRPQHAQLARLRAVILIGPQDRYE